ncbi:MAG: hypothetical protein HYX57_05000 [Chloroflexi bacterium]|nr:hypothetical protein [Chloroflexota bacterium]
MFQGRAQIEAFVAHLKSRDVSLWHACQLRDFRSYLEVGGIPSRSFLEQSRVEFTPFVTDTTDRSAGVWAKVFVNLEDFGASFAHSAEAVPNPYGPIVFQIRPEALLRAADVAVCLRSAGAHDFDRGSESLGPEDDLEALFLHAASAPFPERSMVRHGERLRSAVAPRWPEATAAEVSVTLDPELIPLDEVIAAWVDPIRIEDRDLSSAVEIVAESAGVKIRVRTRYCDEARRKVLADIVRFIDQAASAPSLRMLAGRADVLPETREWSSKLLSRDLGWQFARYAQYLAEGTIRTLEDGDAARVAPDVGATGTTQEAIIDRLRYGSRS